MSTSSLSAVVDFRPELRLEISSYAKSVECWVGTDRKHWSYGGSNQRRIHCTSSKQYVLKSATVVSELKGQNNINFTVLRVGMSLRLPSLHKGLQSTMLTIFSSLGNFF